MSGVYTWHGGGAVWGRGIARYDVTGGDCVVGETSVHVSVLFFAQNKPVLWTYVGPNVFQNESV